MFSSDCGLWMSAVGPTASALGRVAGRPGGACDVSWHYWWQRWQQHHRIKCTTHEQRPGARSKLEATVGLETLSKACSGSPSLVHFPRVPTVGVASGGFGGDPCIKKGGSVLITLWVLAGCGVRDPEEDAACGAAAASVAVRRRRVDADDHLVHPLCGDRWRRRHRFLDVVRSGQLAPQALLAGHHDLRLRLYVVVLARRIRPFSQERYVEPRHSHHSECGSNDVSPRGLLVSAQTFLLDLVSHLGGEE